MFFFKKLNLHEQVDTNNAIAVLKYRLEVPEDLNPTSVIWNYNTQVAGQVEYKILQIVDIFPVVTASTALDSAEQVFSFMLSCC